MTESKLCTSSAATLHDIAVHVAPSDNVAVVKYGANLGTRVMLPSLPTLPGGGNQEISVSEEIPGGHRLALCEIPAGEFVRQYGQPIGTSLGIHAGQRVTHAVMNDEIPVVRELPPHLNTKAPVLVKESERNHFRGFLRTDGRVGTRNWIAVIPTSMCASHEANRIATVAEFTLWSAETHPNVDGVVALAHNKGCGTPDGANVSTILRTLAAYAAHPNVGGVVFLELGCEKTGSSILRDWMEANGKAIRDKPVVWIGIQDEGGTQAAIKRGLTEVEGMLTQVNAAQRTQVSASELVLGLKCGASDGFSGLSANPALGAAADRVVYQGGTAILTEIPEFCGAEHVLAMRSRDVTVGREVYGMVDW